MCTLVSPIIIGQKCPFNTFPSISLFISYPISLHQYFTLHLLSLYQYFTLHLLSLYQYQTHFLSIYHYQTHFQKKKEMKKSSSVQWRIKQLFARYNNFILLNSYLFLNIFEYEVDLILFVSFFFSFILKYDVDCFNLVLI